MSLPELTPEFLTQLGIATGAGVLALVLVWIVVRSAVLSALTAHHRRLDAGEQPTRTKRRASTEVPRQPDDALVPAPHDPPAPTPSALSLPQPLQAPTGVAPASHNPYSGSGPEPVQTIQAAPPVPAAPPAQAPAAVPPVPAVQQAPPPAAPAALAPVALTPAATAPAVVRAPQAAPAAVAAAAALYGSGSQAPVVQPSPIHPTPQAHQPVAQQQPPQLQQPAQAQPSQVQPQAQQAQALAQPQPQPEQWTPRPGLTIPDNPFHQSTEPQPSTPYSVPAPPTHVGRH